ncbi:MAG: PAS domain S-box protein [Bacteroidales bacterium]
MNELLKPDKELLNNAVFHDSSNENIFKQLSENIDDVFWLRTEHEMIYVNPAFEKVWGIPCSQIYQNPQVFLDYIHPDDREKVNETLNSSNFITTGHSEYEYRIIRPDKHVRWIYAKSLPVLNDKGEIIRRVGIARDITLQKKSLEETVSMAEMLDIAPNSITIHDFTGKFLYANQKTFEIHGYSKDEFLTLNLHELDVPESATLIEERIKAIRENGDGIFEVEHFKKDGTIVPLEVYVKLVDWNGSQAMLSIATDISDRKKMLNDLLQSKEKLQEREKRLQSILNNLQDAYFQSDTNGNLVFLNHAAVKMYGYCSKDELLGLPASSLHCDEEAEVAIINTLRLNGQLTDWVCQAKRKDSTVFWVSINAQYLKDSNGNVIGTEGVVRDISDRIMIDQLHHKYKKIISSTPDGIAMLDKEYRYTIVNDAYEKFSNKKREQLIGHSVADYLGEKVFLEEVKHRFDKCLSGEIVKYQMWVDYPELGKRYVDITYFPFINGNKKVEGVVAITKDITDLKLIQDDLITAKEKAEANEIKYKAAFHTSPDSVNINKMNGEYVEINEGFTRLTGYTEEEVIGKLSSEIDIWATPDDRERLVHGLQKDGIVENLESLFRAKDGTLIPALMSAKIIHLNNQPHILSVTRAIVYRKKMEQDLIKAKEIAEENEAKLESYFENAPDGIFIANELGEYVEVNRAATKITGYSEAELLKMSISDLTYELDYNLAKEQFQKLLNAGHASAVLRFITKNKELRYCSIDAVKISKSRFLGFKKDITLQIEAQENTRLLAEMLDTAPNSIIIHDKDGVFLYANQKTFALHGYKPEEFMKLNLKDLGLRQSIDIMNEGHRNTKEKGSTVFEVEINKKDGTKIPLEVYVKLVDWKGSQAMLSISTDISERKKWMSELIVEKEKAEESNRLKTEFLNNMSHEIRTPMNGIIGFSEMLDKPGISDEKRKYYAKIVQNSSHQLLRIIDDILEISTLETKQDKVIEEQLCLNDLMMELFAIFNLKSKERNIPIYIKKALSDSQSQVMSDKTKLNKILGNLLENALKFTSEGYVEFGYFVEKPNLVLYVKDTGIGISPKNHNIIFERFSQEDKEMSRKHGGLGLGLSISKENAHLLGGNITLESEKGKGSVFYVTIPYKPVQNKLNKLSDKSKTTSNKMSYTILVAEDEEVNFLFLEALFEQETALNYQLMHAKNGKEAIEICLKNKNINIVLMDIKMPVMNGHEATKQIKSAFPDLPVIAQTAYSTHADITLALKYGCDDFISKPIDKEKLFGLINKYLDVK